MNPNVSSWNRGAKFKTTPNNEKQGPKPSHKSAELKFKEAHERLQQSVKKHITNEYESSEDEEELETKPILNSVIKEYSSFGGDNEDLKRTQHFLENTFQSGAAVCLICISTVRRIDPIWNCIFCFAFFHLNCIQRWAKDSIAHSKLISEERPGKVVKLNWQCPKCRQDYDQEKIPKVYKCFCGQTEQPKFQPWFVPHSCGEICKKPLLPECGHHCVLLCHPGPCPPCPQVAKVSCFCGRSPPTQVRCSRKNWSCKEVCGQKLNCGKHNCKESCHPGQCPPCLRMTQLSCHCGSSSKPISCAQRSWTCENVCDRMLSCQRHHCKQVCHRSGECGPCPDGELRYCPCGKTSYQIPCDQPVPTCGATCDKLLDCGMHYCPQKCHKGDCGSCLDFVVKYCRCGLHSKEVSCSKEFLCETKCKRMKDCRTHLCNRKCCDGDCPPCEKACGRTLMCGQHKCGSVCHRGQCYPCQVVRSISCPCGYTHLSVPCGKRYKRQKFNCPKRCNVAPECEHAEREWHLCHTGPCPRCRQVCGKQLSCGHLCPQLCHSAPLVYSQPSFKPATPWEKMSMAKELVKVECGPCKEPVSVTCLGGHETTELPCYEAVPRSCGRPCGLPLPCTNHSCSILCHDKNTPCEKSCGFDCLVPQKCEHACLLSCHPAPCPDCSTNLKLPCHCRISFVFIKCHVWQMSDSTSRSALLSCGNQCPKNYSCGHRCTQTCHTGECPGSQTCKKKVKITCLCKRIKKDIQCSQVTSGTTTLNCDSTCEEIKAQKVKEELSKKELARKAEEMKNKLELEKYNQMLQGKRRGRKKMEENKSQDESHISSSKVCFVLVPVLLALVAITAYLFVQLPQ